jgi:hypothetical protein
MSLIQDPLQVKLDEIKRVEQVVALRIAGLSYTQIAKQLGYAGRQGPFEVVKRHLQEHRKELALKVDDVRELEVQRIDTLLRAHWRAATTPPETVDAQGIARVQPLKVRLANLKSAEFVVKLMERRSRLLGLDAPLDIRHSGSMELLSFTDAKARVQAALREGQSAAFGGGAYAGDLEPPRLGDAGGDRSGSGFGGS